MGLHRIGNPLAAPKPGGHEMKSVQPVPARTGAAPSSPAAPASNQQHVVGLPLGRVDTPDFPRRPVHLLDSSPDANRTAAVAGVLDLLAPAAEAVSRPLERLQEDRRVGTVAQGPEVRQVIRARVLRSHPPAALAPRFSVLQTCHYSFECSLGVPGQRDGSGQFSISPQATNQWKEQVPLRSQARQGQPGQAHSRVPTVACTCCMWSRQSLP